MTDTSLVRDGYYRTERCDWLPQILGVGHFFTCAPRGIFSHTREHSIFKILTSNVNSLTVTTNTAFQRLFPSISFSQSLLCFSSDNTESYDPDYDFLHQDLSVFTGDPLAPSGVTSLSPLPESHSESSSPSPVPPPTRFSSPPAPHSEYWTPQPGSHISPLHPCRLSAPPALPQKKRRSTQVSPYPDGCWGGSSRGPLYERFPSQYDNLSEEELLHPTPPFPLFTPISPMPQSNGGVFVAQYLASENADIPSSPPPLPEKRNKHGE